MKFRHKNRFQDLDFTDGQTSLQSIFVTVTIIKTDILFQKGENILLCYSKY